MHRKSRSRFRFLQVGRRGGDPAVKEKLSPGVHHGAKSRSLDRFQDLRNVGRMEETVTIVGDEHSPTLGKGPSEAASQVLLLAGGHFGGTARIDAHHLLFHRVGAPGQNSRLGRSLIAVGGPEETGRDAMAGEALQQRIARGVVPHAPHRDRVGPQRLQVGHGVGAASGKQVRPLVIQDQHRGFTGNADRLAITEFVQYQVGQNEDRDRGDSRQEFQ